MKSEEQILLLEQVSKVLALQFGPQCEVTVHDLAAGRDGPIVAIENGHVTGRKAGDSISEAVQKALHSGWLLEDALSQLTRTSDGRLLKTSSICVRDGNGEPALLFSVHYDITAISHANMILSQFLGTRQNRDEAESALPFSDVNELLERLIEESVQHVGKPVALMSKEDKIRAIHFLDNKGAFLIKKSGDKISKFYDISKYTLYNYMDSDVAP